MNKKLKNKIKMTLLIILIIILVIICYFFIGFSKPRQDITWGVNFSPKHAQGLGLDWKETYLAILDDLGVRNIKLATYWDFIEGKEDQYYFNDLDWQIQEAEKRGAKLILVIGMKNLRWPECHIPEWAENLSKEEQQEKILELLEKIVLRYKNSKAIKYWQVENEPFFSFFGECPWYDEKFLEKEVNLVKSLDPQKQIVLSDGGEMSFWLKPAKYGDIVGTTLYRVVWVRELGFYLHHIYPPTFYRRRAQFIKWIFNKQVICVELQAEPWGPTLLYDLSLSEQEKTMNLEKFKENIEFARKVGFSEIYLWGAEWWYWLKTKQDKPEIWEEAKKLF